MKPLDGLNNERGTVVIIVAVALTMFIGFAAMAVDVGYMMVAKNELQNTADAAALAGARRLGVIYEGMNYAQQTAYNAGADAGAIQSAAIDVALQNRAAGKNIVIDAADISIGTWNSTASPKFSSTLSRPHAVRVTARRDGTANGPVSTFFAKILGINTVNVSATATAALTGQSTAGPASLPIPVGISRAWFSGAGWCNQPIKFYPTGTIGGCAAWNTYEVSPASASRLRNILDGLGAGTYTSPETFAGTTHFSFIGGNAATAFDNMQSLFNVMKIKNDGVLDKDTDPNTWTTSIPVYDYADCNNPTGSLLIIDFTTAVITQIVNTPEKMIQTQVLYNDVDPGQGKNGTYGNLGSIPSLMQ